MTLRTYIDRAIRDGAAFDAVICGCDVQQTFCWQPDMCITNACEAEYRPLLDAEIRILAAAPGERFSIIEMCTDRLFLGDAFSQCAAGYCSPRVPAAVSRRIRQTLPAPEPRLWDGRFFCCASHSMQATIKQQGRSRGQGPPRIR